MNKTLQAVGRTLCSVFAIAFTVSCASESLRVTREPVTMRVVAADSCSSLAHELVGRYEASHPWVTIELEVFDDAVARERLGSGMADLALLSGGDDGQDDASGWQTLWIQAGIAMVANTDTPLNEISLPYLQEIYRGRIQEWQGTVLQVVTREHGSGVRRAFDWAVLGAGDVALTAIVVPSNDAVIDFVARTPGAIGYVSTLSLREADLARVRLLSVDGELPVPSALASGKYPLSHQVRIATPSEPTGATPVIDWLDETTFRIDGIEFSADNFMSAADGRATLINKPPNLVRDYLELIERERPQRIVELGVKDGGSAMLMSLAAEPERLLALDLEAEVPTRLKDFIAGRGLEARVKAVGGVDQSDRSVLTSLLDDWFGEEPLDLVVDDASHMFAPSLRSFDVCFPRLRPGGVFVLEDWPADDQIAAAAQRALEDAGRIARADYDAAAKSGLIQVFDAREPYLEQIARLIDLAPLRGAGLRLVADPMWGVGMGWWPMLLDGGTTTVHEIHAHRNPLFPGMRRPEPIEDNLQGLFAAVREHGADAGLANDGDADRVGLANEMGEFVNQLQVYALLTYYLLEVRGERGPLVKTISTTVMANKLAARYGVDIYETGVGFKYVAPEMLRVDAILGGEESGGFAFRGHIPERDGILAGLYLLDLMVQTGKTPSQLMGLIYSLVGPHYYDRVDRRMTPEQKPAVEAAIRAAQPQRLGGLRVERIDLTDGYRYVLEDGGWLLIRFSGTEPVIRVYCETTHEDKVAALLEDGLGLAGLV